MHATSVARVDESPVEVSGSIAAVDLAKNVFQLAVADRSW